MIQYICKGFNFFISLTRISQALFRPQKIFLLSNSYKPGGIRNPAPEIIDEIHRNCCIINKESNKGKTYLNNTNRNTHLDLEKKMTVTGEFIQITPNAAEEVKKLIAAEGKPEIGLRLGVKGGGCSGLSYNLEFSPREEGDTVIDSDGFNVFMDPKSLIYLKGMQLDFQGGLSGKGFVFQNPNAASTCGCGESFSLT